MLTISLFISLFILAKAFQLIYFFQIKEYRFDRFFSFIKEEGWYQALYFSSFRLPAKKTRNLLIMGLLFVADYLIFQLLLKQSLPLLILDFFIVPLIAFLLTSVAVFLTAIPVYIYRQWLITRAKSLVKRSSAICIGITGSYGKTSVKEFLYEILSQKFKVAKTEKNMNTDVGIALSIIGNLKSDTRYFIAEYGGYRTGEIERTAKIIRPNQSILTGLGNQHLDLYGSRKNLQKAETHILTLLDLQSFAYINLDFPQSRVLTQKSSAKKIYYSIHQKTDIYAANIKTTPQGTSADVYYHRHKIHLQTALLGKHNILNLLPCLALAIDLNMTTQEITHAISKIQPISGKLSVLAGIKGAVVVDDSYNTNVNGFLAAIEVLNTFDKSKKIIATRGIIELGVEKSSSYKTILQALAKTGIALFTTDRLFKELDQAGKITTFNDVSDLIIYLKETINQDTVLLIEGRFPESTIKKLKHNS